MRLPPIPPEKLSEDQKKAYDVIRKGVEDLFKGSFTAKDASGAMLGPFNIWVRWPRLGLAMWHLTEVISTQSKLSDSVRQIGILTVGAKFNCAFELYAHLAVAENVDKMKKSMLSTLVSGSKPEGLGDDESLAYDIAHVIASGRIVPDITYELGVKAFGEDGMGEYIQLCAFYCMISGTLNGCNQLVPDAKHGQTV